MEGLNHSATDLGIPDRQQTLASYWNLMIVLEKDGAAEGTRTPDPIITNDVLYHLSYSGQLAGA